MSREIPLTRGLVAIVDDEDFDWLNQWKWRALRASTKEQKWYAYRSTSDGVSIYMHRLICGDPVGMDIDHRDYDGLNNRRANLRVASRALNIRAKRCSPGISGFRGVRPCNGRWIASFRLSRHADGRRPYVSVGTYDDPTDAARAYDRAALEHFGEFAVLNFPGEGVR